jgi:Ser-tRNA(Ala) deacylase AlaX
VKLKQPEVQRNTVETPIQNKKKKKKKKKDMYAGLNRAIVLAHTSKGEVSLLERESENKKENKVVDIIPLAQQAVPPQEEQLPSRRRKWKGGENCGDLAMLSMAGQKVQSTVRQQIKEAKLQIIASRKKHKEKVVFDLQNKAKKTRRCNASQNILATASAASQSTRPTLKEFLASLN